MGLTRTTDPTEDAVSVVEAKEFAKVDGNDQDDLILSLVRACTNSAEQMLRRQIVTATYTQTLDFFPAWKLQLDFPPLASVTSIQYVDADGTTQTWASSNYSVITDSHKGFVEPVYGVSYPSTRTQSNAVTVVYVAGYGAASAVPDAIKTGIKMMVVDALDHPSKRIEFSLTENPILMDLMGPYRVVEVY